MNTKAVCTKHFLVFRPHQLLLTAAIGAATPTIDVAYDIPRMYKYLDYIHVMCYDYHGKWDRKTGHNAPLYPRPNEKGQDVLLNVDNTLEYLMKKGALPEKTVLGVPLYGRAFSLMNPHDYKMGARAKTTSFQVQTHQYITYLSLIDLVTYFKKKTLLQIFFLNKNQKVLTTKNMQCYDHIFTLRNLRLFLLFNYVDKTLQALYVPRISRNKYDMYLKI